MWAVVLVVITMIITVLSWPTDTRLTSDVADTPDNDGRCGVLVSSLLLTLQHYTVHLQHLSTCCQPPLIYTPILQLIIRGRVNSGAVRGRGGLLGIIMTGNMQQTVYFRYKFTGEQILSKYLIASAGGNWILFGV